MFPTLRRPVAVVLSLFLVAVSSASAHAQPVEQDWAAAVRGLRYLGTAWNDGVPRGLAEVSATGAVRVVNLQTGALEGTVPTRYGGVTALDIQYVDAANDGVLRLLLTGRASAGANWFVGAFNLTPGGNLALAWEKSQTTMLGVHVTRILGGGEDVVTRRLSGASSDGYLNLYDGVDGALLWDQQVAGVPPHVTFLDSDFNGDGLTDWLLEVRTGTSAPIETRLYQASNPAVGVPGPLTGMSLGLAPTVPNPFAGDTRIAWTQGSTGDALVRVFDPAGREVRTLERGRREAGAHQLTWDGRDDAGRAVPAGLYFVEVRAGGESQARRMIRLP